MILVIVEAQADRVNAASLEALAAARAIGGPVTVVGLGADLAATMASLGRSEGQTLVALEHEALATYTADGFVSALAAYVPELAPDWVVIAHTYQARDYVPALAARLGRALVTDCTGLKRQGKDLVLTRPMFRGKVSADVVAHGPSPHFATFQAGAFRAVTPGEHAEAADVQRIAAALDPSAIRQRPESPFREAKLAVDLTQAQRIVAIGRGIKDRDSIAVAETLAGALGAELAASRPICDAGWLPMDRQVGSSGQTVAPELYVALGISGAIQHIVGMRGARTVVAINKDPEAPIFEIADYGIVGDLFEVVPAIVSALK